MTHLVWRLHRNQAYVAVAALVSLAVVLLITGVVMADDYRRALAACSPTGSCGDLSSVLFRGDGSIMDLVDATLVVPILFGLFWGAPLLAKEFEDGTHNLVWTQGMSRARWLRANVAWATAGAALWAGALTALVSWWRYPENALHSRFDAFDVQGIVPVAYVLFAVALGLAVGSVLRRVLPSLAATLAIFAAIRVSVALYLRPHFMAPLRVVSPVIGSGAGVPQGGWALSNDYVNGRGQSLGAGIDPQLVPATCRTAAPGGGGIDGHCLAQHGFHQVITYQPASRFWAFQGIESGLFLVLAVGLVAFATWWVLARDA